jgi:hypothetical protein
VEKHIAHKRASNGDFQGAAQDPVDLVDPGLLQQRMRTAGRKRPAAVFLSAGGVAKVS